MALFNPHVDPSALRAQLAQDDGQRIVCYCAAWCRTCDAYQPALEDLARRLPDWTFIWVDVEDSPEWLGDVDVENFPTILIEDAKGTRFWGPQLPRAEHLQRLIEGLAALPVLSDGPGPVDALAGGC